MQRLLPGHKAFHRQLLPPLFQKRGEKGVRDSSVTLGMTSPGLDEPDSSHIFMVALPDVESDRTLPVITHILIFLLPAYCKEDVRYVGLPQCKSSRDLFTDRGTQAVTADQTSWCQHCQYLLLLLSRFSRVRLCATL
ncbi:hypothetical protein MG293_000573 [Ovis ammon polii]|uniref:Uncharacterized protein n=1 Tax=Ovis ammon polii TaxID=230172 RepID=A0AAD4UL16_OVIAM|nr:hypothetical protein MG293_000573 [Ovis ammon polii]